MPLSLIFTALPSSCDHELSGVAAKDNVTSIEANVLDNTSFDGSERVWMVFAFSNNMINASIKRK